MRRVNLDIQDKKPVCNDAGHLCLDVKAKQAAWKEHYECLSNIEFDWNQDSVTEVYPVEGPGDHFTKKVSSLWKLANFSNFITFSKLAHLVGECVSLTGLTFSL